MKPIPSDSAVVLASIAKLLIAERASVKEALETAYRLGAMDGRIDMTRLASDSLRLLQPKVAA